MKANQTKRWSVAMGAGLLATVSVLPQARGELVYENESPTMNENQNSVQIEDRSTMRQAIGSSQKMQATHEASTAPQAEAPVAQAAPQSETDSQYKHELMRRERTREEVKNEDMLQARLEELRLRDERKRLDQMFGATGPTGDKVTSTASAPAPMAMPMAMKEEVVVAPVTEHPGTPSQAPHGLQNPMLMSAPASGASQAMLTVDSTTDERTMISVAPRAGLSNMVGQGGYFDVRPRFAAGIGAQVSASDNFSFELGYLYNEYGIAMASSNPFVLYRQQTAMMYGVQSNFESVAMRQNVIDAGLKVHVLGAGSKLRPFIGGGGAYSKSFINFDPRILGDMNRYYGRSISPDYDVQSFLGYVASGMDVKVAKNISVGAEFKYYAVLSARENQSFNNYYGAMYQPAYGAMMPGAYGVNPMGGNDTAVAGGSLARSAFYSILGSVTFTF